MAPRSAVRHRRAGGRESRSTIVAVTPDVAATGCSTNTKLAAPPWSRALSISTLIDVQPASRPFDVLVVDDEPMVREVIAGYLERDGHRVHEVADGDEAMAWLDGHQPDLVVLDLMLPGTDGLSILRHVRATSAVPVILLTARTEEIDRVLGLELGADDYVVKPFSPRELAVRVRNMLRRSSLVGAPSGSSSSPATVLDFGDLRIDPEAREVSVAGTVISLTRKEFDLLVLLARSPRQVFSRRQLLELVWESSADFQDPATVTVHVGRLRQKIEARPEEPRWIVTAWGIGYRFEP